MGRCPIPSARLCSANSCNGVKSRGQGKVQEDARARQGKRQRVSVGLQARANACCLCLRWLCLPCLRLPCLRLPCLRLPCLRLPCLRGCALDDTLSRQCSRDMFLGRSCVL